MTAALLPDKRFRFEAQIDMGQYAEISDGTSEWTYLSQIGQYTKQSAPSSIPGPMPNVAIPGINSLLQARRLLGKVSAPRSWIRSAMYLPDDAIDVDGQRVLCTVVEARGAVP